MLAADGAFLPDGRFVALPPVPGSLLAEGFRRAVLDFLVKNEALLEEFRSRMLAWRHGGFSAHNEVGVAAEDAEGRKQLAAYMLRAPMSLQKMTYDAATGTVIAPPSACLLAATRRDGALSNGSPLRAHGQANAPRARSARSGAYFVVGNPCNIDILLRVLLLELHPASPPSHTWLWLR